MAEAAFISYAFVSIYNVEDELEYRIYHVIIISLGILSLEVYFCGLLHILRIWILAVGLLPTVFLALAKVYHRPQEMYASRRTRRRFFDGANLIIVLCVAMFSLLTMYPPTAWDGLMYHLPLAIHYATYHRISYDPFIRYSFAPQANEMLMTIVFLSQLPARATQVVQFLMYILVIWGTKILARRVSGSWAISVIAAALVAGTPIMIFEGTVPYIDLWPVAFGLAGMVLLVRVYETNSLPLSRLTGMYLGLAADGKDVGFLLGISVIVVTLIFRTLRARTWPIALFMLAFMVPWYLRTFLLTGNPVYPLLASVFPNRGPWTQLQLAYQGYALHGTTETGFMLLVHNVKTAIAGMYGGTQEGIVGVVPRLTWWAAGAGLANVKFWRNKKFSVVLCVAGMYTMGWLIESPIIRYGLFILPCVAIAAAYGFKGAIELLSYPARKAGVRRRMLGGLTGLASFAGLLAGIKYTVNFVTGNGLPPWSASGVYTYYADRFPTYPLYVFLNSHFGSSYVVYAVFDERMTFFSKGPHIGDWFGPGSYFTVLGPNPGHEPVSASFTREVYNRLRKLDVNFLVLPSSASYLAQEPYFDRFFVKIKEITGGTLYRLID